MKKTGISRSVSDDRIRRVIRYYYSWQMPVITSTLSVEPLLGVSNAGARYILPIGKSGPNWTGMKANSIVEWTGYKWVEIRVPPDPWDIYFGSCVYDFQSREYLMFEIVGIGPGGQWKPISSAILGVLLQDGSRPLTADWDVGGFEIYGLPEPTMGSSATNKDYVDALVQGLDWQESVIDFWDASGGLPAGPSVGDRYICSVAGGGWALNYIYEYNGLTWTEINPDEGTAVWVEDENVLYVWNTVAWVKFGTTVTHANLLGLQGGTSDEYYHLTATQHGLIGATNIPVASLAPGTNGDFLTTSGGIPIWTSLPAVPAHASTHENSGSDEINVDGLSGLLADIQYIQVEKDSAGIGKRPRLNFVTGGNTSLTVSDDAVGDEVDVTIAVPNASTATRGAVELATSSEITAGLAVQASDTRLPTQDENDALAGTSGTPSASNKYVTNTDSRLSDDRTDANAIHKNVASEIHAITDVAPASGDEIVIEDASNSWNKRKCQLGDIASVLDYDNLTNKPTGVSGGSTHGSSAHTDATRRIFLPVTAMTQTDGSALPFSSHDNIFGVLYTDTGVAGTYALGTFCLDKNIVPASSTVKIYVVTRSTIAEGARYVINYSGARWGGISGSNATPISGSVVHSSSGSVVTRFTYETEILSVSGDFVTFGPFYFQVAVRRDSSHASDTYTGDANLIGLILEYTDTNG